MLLFSYILFGVYLYLNTQWKKRQNYTNNIKSSRLLQCMYGKQQQKGTNDLKKYIILYLYIKRNVRTKSTCDDIESHEKKLFFSLLFFCCMVYSFMSCLLLLLFYIVCCLLVLCLILFLCFMWITTKRNIFFVYFVVVCASSFDICSFGFNQNSHSITKSIGYLKCFVGLLIGFIFDVIFVVGI